MQNISVNVQDDNSTNQFKGLGGLTLLHSFAEKMKREEVGKDFFSSLIWTSNFIQKFTEHYLGKDKVSSHWNVLISTCLDIPDNRYRLSFRGADDTPCEGLVAPMSSWTYGNSEEKKACVLLLAKYYSFITNWSVTFSCTQDPYSDFYPRNELFCFGNEWLPLMETPALRLNRLEVEENNLSLDVIKAIASCPFLTSLTLEYADPIVKSGCTNVDVIRLLVKSKSITELGLRGSVLNGRDGKESEILAENPKLKKLKITDCLSLIPKHISSTVRMLQFLANSKSLTHLHMYEHMQKNEDGGELVEPVAEALAAMPNLFRLQLSSSWCGGVNPCSFSDNAAEKLAKSKSIKELSLGYSNIFKQEEIPTEWLPLESMVTRNLMPFKQVVAAIVCYRANKKSPLRNSLISLLTAPASDFRKYISPDEKGENEDPSVDRPAP